MKIYLDDERATPEGWVRTCTVAQTIQYLETGDVSHLSLDNDLGDGQEEGYKVLDWLEEQVYFNSSYNLPEIEIHSSNTARVEYMQRAMESIYRLKNR